MLASSRDIKIYIVTSHNLCVTFVLRKNFFFWKDLKVPSVLDRNAKRTAKCHCNTRKPKGQTSSNISPLICGTIIYLSFYYMITFLVQLPINIYNKLLYYRVYQKKVYSRKMSFRPKRTHPIANHWYI